jgi:hypothetical protein
MGDAAVIKVSPIGMYMEGAIATSAQSVAPGMTMERRLSICDHALRSGS